MFTGIIQGLGKVRKVQSFPDHRRLVIRTPFSLKDTRPGDSIAVDGCCLTVTGIRGVSFFADVSPETLKRTTLGDFRAGLQVNLETALKFGRPLGGHVVQGHVDGVGLILSRRLVRTGRQKYLFLSIQVPSPLKKYLVEKGSVAVDGVSLTVNSVDSGLFQVCLIPHTQKGSALTGKKIGDKVNIEVDVLAKYLEQLIKKK